MEVLDRRAHLKDRELYKTFYDIDTQPGTATLMEPYEPRLRWALKHIRPYDNVLDVGCHKGEMTRHLKKITTGRVVGLDIAKHAIDYARKVCPDVEWVRGDAEELPPEWRNLFDVVILSEILEHVVDPEKVVAEAERVCRPRGTIVISVPTRAIEMDRHEAKWRDTLGLALDMHVREYNPDDHFSDRPGYRSYEGAVAGYPWTWKLASYWVEK